MNTITLNNNVQMPVIGLGVYRMVDEDQTAKALSAAFDVGYRHIDTASIYGNEELVGKAIQDCPIERTDLFVVSKVWNSDQGFESTLRAYDESLHKLKTDYLDLYLIHWPVKGKYIDTWRAMEKIYAEGRVRAIGVSNFMMHHLDDLMKEATIKPAVNQVEFHPYLSQPNLRQYCKKHSIQYESWSPLMKGDVLNIKELKPIASTHNKTIPQVVLRWNIQHNIITIPKSSNPKRISENFDVFDFELSQEEMKLIDGLNRNHRIGPHPDNFDF